MGRTEEPVLKGLRHFGDVNKLYILHSPDSKEEKLGEVARGVKKKLEDTGFKGVVLKEIDAFDMNSVVNSILEIADQEKPPYFVNMTGGTNLMAGAACAASFFIGARAYYVPGKRGNEDQITDVIELPIPNVPIYRTVEQTALRILKALEELGGRVPNIRLRDHLRLSAQLLSYQVNELKRKGLVNVTRGDSAANATTERVDNRMIFVELTSAGRLISSWSSSGTRKRIDSYKTPF